MWRLVRRCESFLYLKVGRGGGGGREAEGRRRMRRAACNFRIGGLASPRGEAHIWMERMFRGVRIWAALTMIMQVRGL